MLRIFPAPKFLCMTSAGLDISGRSVRSIELLQDRLDAETFLPHRYGAVPLPEGVVVGGEIVNKAPLVKALAELKEKNKLNLVTVSLPEEKAYLFKITLPKIAHTEESIDEQIAFHLEENVPIAGPDALYEWNIVNQTQHEITVAVSVVSKTLVDSYTEVIRAAGLTPVSFDTESRATARAVLPVEKEGGDTKTNLKTRLLVTVGETKTVFCVASRGVIQFTSTLFVGQGMMTSIIEKELAISREEARTLLRTKNFFITDDAANTSVSSELQDVIDHINQEIKKLGAYWYTRKDNDEMSRRIDEVILCGETSLVVGFVDALRASSPFPIQLANVWQGCFSFDRYIPDMSFEQSVSYGTAIGLALLPYSKRVWV